MGIVSIDTSLKTNSISISVKNTVGIFTHNCSFSERLVAEKLLGSLELALDVAGVGRAEIETIIVPEGPGSFTGLRLAFSLGKALQLSCGASFIAVPTLECLATSVLPFTGQLLVAIDARRNSVYGQIFKNAESASEVFDKPFSQILPLLQNKETLCLCYGYNTILESLDREGLKEKDLNYIKFIEYKNVFSLDILNYFLQNEERLLSIQSDDYIAPFYVRKSDAKRGRYDSP